MVENNTWHVLRRLRSTGLGAHHDLQHRLRTTHLTPGELEILQLLHVDCGLSASVVARRLDLRRQTLRPVLLSLEARGLLHRHLFLRDPRAIAFSATQAGEERLARGARLAGRLEQHLLSWLGRRDTTILQSLLERAEHALQLARRLPLSRNPQWHGAAGRGPPPVWERLGGDCRACPFAHLTP